MNQTKKWSLNPQLLSKDWANPSSGNFNTYRALKKVDGEDETVLAADVKENSFDSGEGAEIDLDLVAGFEIGPWLGGNSGIHYLEDSVDFGLVDCRGDSGGRDDEFDPWGANEGETEIWVEAGEDVAWEERDFNFLDAVGVEAWFDAGGGEDVEVLLGEVCGDAKFASSADFNGVPG